MNRFQMIRDEMLHSLKEATAKALNESMARWNQEWMEAESRYREALRWRDQHALSNFRSDKVAIDNGLRERSLDIRKKAKEEADSVEYSILHDELERNEWNVSQTARSLGLNRVFMISKMRRLGLDANTVAGNKPPRTA